MKDIKSKVASCAVCQQNKYETLSPPGLLQPLPIPAKVWSNISMDFITNIPPCKGKIVIWVVVDRLSKYAHFTVLNHPYTTSLVAQLFVDNIFKLHGMSQSIVCDRDPVFMNKFWKELFQLQGSELWFSSGYHPQTDGQTEVLNRCLETYLRCFCTLHPKKLVPWLSWAEWSYNTSFHSTLKMTPFEAVYGYVPLLVPAYETSTTKVELVEQSLKERNSILSLFKSNLATAQCRMKV